MNATANIFLGFVSVALLSLFFVLLLRNRGSEEARKRLARNEVPMPEGTEELPAEASRESWIDVAAFPMEYRNIQPLGSQIVTRKTFHDHLADYLALLEAEGIPYQTHVAEASTFQAEAVRVPKDHWEIAKAILDKLEPRDELF